MTLEEYELSVAKINANKSSINSTILQWENKSVKNSLIPPLIVLSIFKNLSIKTLVLYTFLILEPVKLRTTMNSTHIFALYLAPLSTTS